jgi:hypothetical protein
METNKNLRRERVEALASKFEAALSNVVTVFADHAFQRWQPEREDWRNQVLASLYDAEMLALQSIFNCYVRRKRQSWQVSDNFLTSGNSYAL